MTNLKVRLFLLFCFFSTIFACCTVFQDSQPSSREEGDTAFPASASGEVLREFNKGLVALHSFWYVESRVHFQKARELDPNFAMAYWGEAMTYDHQFWHQHDQQEAMKVWSQLDEKIEEGTVKWSAREKDYIRAALLLFEYGVPMEERRDNYAAEMVKLTQQYPDDQEAAAFEALAAISVKNFNFTYRNNVIPVIDRLKAIIEQNPKHLGALHYLIHVCDTKEFAEMAVPAAEMLMDLEPEASHVIHMPSHIYKHLGRWEKVAELNLEAYQASVKWQQETGRSLRSRDFHAFRWLHDAYLKLDNFGEACNLLGELKQLMAEAESQGDEDSHNYLSFTFHDLSERYANANSGSPPRCDEVAKSPVSASPPKALFGHDHF